MATPVNYTPQSYGINTPQTQQSFMSGYPATPMYSLPPPQNISPQASVPPWAAELIEDIKQLKSVLPSINKIDQTLTQINAKMYDLEIKVTSIDNRDTEVENSRKYMGQSFDQHTTELKAAKETVAKIDKRCNNLGCSMNTLQEENTSLKKKILDLENWSMRNNLLFWGLPEPENRDRPEICNETVKRFISDELGIDSTSMTFERAHRIPANPGPHTKKPRPAVVNFYYYQERERIMSEATKRSQALRGKGLGVGPQRPKEIRDARRALRDVMVNARARGQHVRMYGDKLFINEKPYRPQATSENGNNDTTSGN